MRIILFYLSFLLLCTESVLAQNEQKMFYALNTNPYLLDQITTSNPSVAYSVRKLKRKYTGYAMRVRRSSGGSPSGDVAFDGTGVVSGNSIITITTVGTSGYTLGAKMNFSTFYSGASVYVSTWYDQSGNSRDVTQSTAGQQPRIVNAGTLEVSNSKASVKFINANSTLLTATIPSTTMFTSGYQGTASLVLEASSGSTSAFGYSDGGTDRWQAHMDEGSFLYFDVGSSYTRLSYTNSANQGLLRTYALVAGVSLQQIWVSGSMVASASGALSASTTSAFNIGGIPLFPGTWYHDDHQSELIIFPTNLSNSDLSKLYNNQKVFFGTP
jgi:hypothetical protein